MATTSWRGEVAGAEADAHHGVAGLQSHWTLGVEAHESSRLP